MRHLRPLCVSDVSSYMQDEDEENPDEDLPQEECLSPIINLERFLYDPKVRREKVGSAVLDTLRTVSDCPAEVASVVYMLNTLVSDPEVPVRAEIVNTLPHVAALCHNEGEHLPHLIPDVILPLILELLTDKDNQVWKLAHPILLLLMEEGLIETNTIEEQVCPVILMLTEEDNPTEIHAEAVSLMVKMAPLVGKETTERLFLHRFVALCSNSVFQFRKTCASNFSYFCSVVGAEYVENVMLPLFVKLCADSIWNVRKACAEVFMSVTCLCSLETRKNVLAPAFARLLTDESRMVLLVAFQQLGPFISTFADPSVTGLLCTGEGEIFVLDPEEDEEEVEVSHGPETASVNETPGITFHPRTKHISEKETRMSSVKKWHNRNYLYDADCLEECQISPPVDPPPQPPGDPPRPSLHMGSVANSSEIAYSSDSSGNCSDSSVIVGNPVNDLPSPCNRLLETQNSPATNIHSKPCADYPRKPPPKPPGDRPPDPPVLIHTISERLKNENNKNAQITLVENPLEPATRGEQHVAKCSSSEVVSGNGDLNCSHSDCGGRGKYHIHLESGLASYNTFQYWRMPIPELELDISLNEQLKPATVTVKARVQDEKRTFASELSVDMDIDRDLDQLATRLDSLTKIDSTCNKSGDSSMDKGIGAGMQAQIGTTAISYITDEHQNSTVLESSVRKAILGIHPDSTTQSYTCVNLAVTTPNFVSLNSAPPPPPPPPPLPLPSAPQCVAEELSQALVPQVLIDHFISMTHPELTKIESEMPHHCAFSIPAVALTLGRKHWGLIRNTYEQLASHNQWKVRHTVASSIHELAKILGKEITKKDLVPIFSGFIKDLDEVRIGILRHLADFLRLLSPSDRKMYLPQLKLFHLSENASYWRFRHELAHQMFLAVELFPPSEVCRHMGPLALLLLVDKVAHVRKGAIRLMSALISHLSADPDLLGPLVSELREKFAQCPSWSHRQTFAMLCCQLLEHAEIVGTEFSEVWLPPLISLSTDRVPNVRLVVAQTLSRIMMLQNFLPKNSEEVVISTLHSLKSDSDRDVRSFVVQKEI